MGELISIIRQRIQVYIERHGMRLEQLAREIDVPLVQLHAIAKGKATTCPLHVCFAILSKIAPDEAIPLMREYHRFGLDLFGSRYDISDHGKGDAGVARLVFKSISHYRLYAWILAGMKFDMMLETFGLEGSRILDEFLENGIIFIEDDGSLRQVRSNPVVMTQQLFAQQASLNLESFNWKASPFLMNNELAALNEEAIQRVWHLIEESNRKINEIFRDPANAGETPLTYSIAFSKLPKSLNSDNFDRAITHAAGLAHDMRAPLRHISSYLDGQTSAAGDEALKRAQTAVLRVDHMIEALRKQEIEEIVSRQVDSLRMENLLAYAECLSDDFLIKFSFSGSMIVRGFLDTEKVNRAIQNLLSNAFEAARSAVHVEWFEDEDSWVVRISDDGAGIPEVIASRIFDRGFTSGKPQGTGIGLAQVKSLADGHDGTIQYTRSEGRTVFTLVLRNVFAPASWDEASQCQTVAIEKPILFLEVSDVQLQASLLQALQVLIPQYQMTSDRALLSKAQVACTDALETALLASDEGARRVWNPRLESMRNLRFAEALKQLADNELANMTGNSPK